MHMGDAYNDDVCIPWFGGDRFYYMQIVYLVKIHLFASQFVNLCVVLVQSYYFAIWIVHNM